MVISAPKPVDMKVFETMLRRLILRSSVESTKKYKPKFLKLIICDTIHEIASVFGTLTFLSVAVFYINFIFAIMYEHLESVFTNKNT